MHKIGKISNFLIHIFQTLLVPPPISFKSHFIYYTFLINLFRYLRYLIFSSPLLVPLTKLRYIHRNFKWMKFKQNAFDNNNHIGARDTLLPYPDTNDTIKIHTNASAFQLETVISMKSKHITLYSGKLTDIQQRYTIT